jgi:hypothetical protein
LHGAICRPAPNHTAFALRQPGYTSRIFWAWRDSNQADVSIKWVKDLSAALEPFGNDKLYLNYLTEGLGERGVKTAYATNYERLAMLKSKYDPTSFTPTETFNRGLQDAKDQNINHDVRHIMCPDLMGKVMLMRR